jgi:hypothetical protein
MVYTCILPAKDGFSLLSISPRLALMYRALKRPGKGGRKDRIQCAYFGFDSESEAKAFIDLLKERYGADTFPQLREPEPLSECAFEVKVREFPNLLKLVLTCARKAEERNRAAA